MHSLFWQFLLTFILLMILAPTPSVYDLALAYAAKYGGKISKEQIPLAVTICLPVMLLVILVIGFIWWKENIKIKSKEEKLSLIKIKKLRELDNFSSLEHMGKFSSRMETKVFSCDHCLGFSWSLKTPFCSSYSSFSHDAPDKAWS